MKDASIDTDSKSTAKAKIIVILGAICAVAFGVSAVVVNLGNYGRIVESFDNSGLGYAVAYEEAAIDLVKYFFVGLFVYLLFFSVTILTNILRRKSSE